VHFPILNKGLDEDVEEIEIVRETEIVRKTEKVKDTIKSEI
jgi:hypothetical protein